MHACRLLCGDIMLWTSTQIELWCKPYICNLAGQVVIDVFRCTGGCLRVLVFGVCEHICVMSP